ncbi:MULTISPECIES: cell wall metabolism sensor histidine kinase WalK [unclassified Nocardia]|uniref:sensor histidine kinase n=1 Tax=unclassified Nocardia TaxID=2637762 RepID=UPI001CE499C6|nr:MULTISPECIES: HAMP domain-containing sensor histidine kinase [unclassified Nocardia]
MIAVRVAAARRSISEALSAIPLRITLVIALVFTAGLGLLISGGVVTSELYRSLQYRTDQDLREGLREWGARHRMLLTPPPPGEQQHRSSSQFYVRYVSADGRIGNVEAFSVPARPNLPDHPVGHPITVGSVDGSSIKWRAMDATTPDGTVTVALPLTKNKETVANLIQLELMVGALVLLLLAVIAYFVIRRSLRPLRQVEQTAAAIAAGDLHRRVPVRGNNTEVDLLSQSLNSMLAQIQQAFAATEASETAARRSEAKMRRFVADASHELRTPLTTIRGFAELYRQGAAKDPATFMDRIEREARRMGLLVEDLLMLARMDAQRPLELGPVDLLSLASDEVHNARAVAAASANGSPKRRIELEISSGEGTLEVLGDEARLRQVLVNLLTNALTHTPPDASVTVRLTPHAEQVLLEVADTGPGLPADEAERVFERFYRTDTSRTRASGGTGLGLSIVQALVNAHGGSVTAYSELGKGTVFVVALPRNPGSDRRDLGDQPAAVPLVEGDADAAAGGGALR